MNTPHLRFFVTKRLHSVLSEEELLQTIENRVKEHALYVDLDVKIMSEENFRDSITKKLFEDNELAKKGEPSIYRKMCVFRYRG